MSEGQPKSDGCLPLLALLGVGLTATCVVGFLAQNGITSSADIQRLLVAPTPGGYTDTDEDILTPEFTDSLEDYDQHAQDLLEEEILTPLGTRIENVGFTHEYLQNIGAFNGGFLDGSAICGSGTYMGIQNGYHTILTVPHMVRNEETGELITIAAFHQPQIEGSTGFTLTEFAVGIHENIAIVAFKDVEGNIPEYMKGFGLDHIDTNWQYTTGSSVKMVAHTGCASEMTVQESQVLGTFDSNNGLTYIHLDASIVHGVSGGLWVDPTSELGVLLAEGVTKVADQKHRTYPLKGIQFATENAVNAFQIKYPGQ